MSLTSTPRRLSRISILFGSLIAVVVIAVSAAVLWAVTDQSWQHGLIAAVAAVATTSVAARVAMLVLRLQTVSTLAEAIGHNK